MRLQPLTQWMCDDCHEVIEKPAHGYLEWLTDDDHKARGFRIVHHAPHSPRRPEGNCYQYTNHRGRSDMHLRTYLGPEGIPALLMMLDVGPHHQPDYEGPDVRDVREWVELFRRLQIAYYEEARLYWSDAREDDFFDGANELWIYLPDTLEKIVREYGQRSTR